MVSQSHLLASKIDIEEQPFFKARWMALDRTRYMQDVKTFLTMDRAFRKNKDLDTGCDKMSVTLTDRIRHGTYLFNNGPEKPSVICQVILE